MVQQPFDHVGSVVFECIMQGAAPEWTLNIRVCSRFQQEFADVGLVERNCGLESGHTRAAGLQRVVLHVDVRSALQQPVNDLDAALRRRHRQWQSAIIQCAREIRIRFQHFENGVGVVGLDGLEEGAHAWSLSLGQG